jgi:DNA-binding transcriptional LysR family regulator
MNRHDLDPLAVFVVVAALGSFTAAAGKLGMTASAASQKIKALEDRLGVRLLERTTRTVVVTEAGAQLQARSREAFAMLDEAMEDARRHGQRPAGTLRLTMPQVVAEAIVGPRLAAFAAAHPGLHVEIVIDDVPTELVRRGFDGGIRIGEAVLPEMEAIPVGPEARAAVVGAPAYFERAGRPDTPEDLTGRPCILRRHAARAGRDRWPFARDGRRFEVAVSGTLAVDDVRLMRRAALDGLGLALLSEDLVAEDLARGRLERVLAAWCPPTPGYHLYYPNRAHPAPATPPAKLRAFIDFFGVESGAAAA